MAGTNTSDGKSYFKLILFSILGILVVAGAGTGWFLFGTGDEQTVEVEDTPPVIEVPARLAYIDLRPLFIQVKTTDGRLQNVVVTLSLEVEEGSEHERRVERELPRLYEAYLQTLTERPIPGAVDGKVEVIHIKNRIRAENLRLLGPGTVYEVVLRNIWITEG